MLRTEITFPGKVIARGEGKRRTTAIHAMMPGAPAALDAA